MGTRCADHVTPLYPQKLALTSPTGGGRSVGIVRVRTKATEFVVVTLFVGPVCTESQYIPGRHNNSTSRQVVYMTTTQYLLRIPQQNNFIIAKKFLTIYYLNIDN